MKTKVFLYTAIRITIFCAIGYFGSWVLEDSHEFFNDKLIPNEYRTDSTGKQYVLIGEHYNWSARHIWVSVFTVMFMLLSITDMIIGTIRIVKKQYPELNN